MSCMRVKDRVGTSCVRDSERRLGDFLSTQSPAASSVPQEETGACPGGHPLFYSKINVFVTIATTS